MPSPKRRRKFLAPLGLGPLQVEQALKDVPDEFLIDWVRRHGYPVATREQAIGLICFELGADTNRIVAEYRAGEGSSGGPATAEASLTPPAAGRAPERERLEDGGMDADEDGGVDGQKDGDRDGERDGVKDGATTGTVDGAMDVAMDGGTDGQKDGVMHGGKASRVAGQTAGRMDGTPDGAKGGDQAGLQDGARDGTTDGGKDGDADGATDGSMAGSPDVAGAAGLDVGRKRAPVEPVGTAGETGQRSSRMDGGQDGQTAGAVAGTLDGGEAGHLTGSLDISKGAATDGSMDGDKDGALGGDQSGARDGERAGETDADRTGGTAGEMVRPTGGGEGGGLGAGVVGDAGGRSDGPEGRPTVNRERSRSRASGSAGGVAAAMDGDMDGAVDGGMDGELDGARGPVTGERMPGARGGQVVSRRLAHVRRDIARAPFAAFVQPQSNGVEVHLLGQGTLRVPAKVELRRAGRPNGVVDGLKEWISGRLAVWAEFSPGGTKARVRSQTTYLRSHELRLLQRLEDELGLPQYKIVGLALEVLGWYLTRRLPVPETPPERPVKRLGVGLIELPVLERGGERRTFYMPVPTVALVRVLAMVTEREISDVINVAINAFGALVFPAE